jgi:hypothetical protein
MNQISSKPAAKHETKFVFSNSRAHLIIQWLGYRCLPDPEFPVGIVSSIYYDTRDWHFLREKINSDYLKTKVRVRWYADITSNKPEEYSFIELKQKIGATRRKIRLESDLSGRWLSTVNLDNQRLLDIPLTLRTKVQDIPMHMHPVFQISYKRWRFIESVTGTRLCIDQDICVPKVNHLIIPNTTPLCLRNAVFELKGQIRELPHSLQPLTILGCRKQSFSKYMHCYQQITT